MYDVLSVSSCLCNVDYLFANKEFLVVRQMIDGHLFKSESSNLFTCVCVFAVIYNACT